MQHELNRQLVYIGNAVYLIIRKGIGTALIPSGLSKDISIDKFYLLKRALHMDFEDEATRKAISILLNE